MWFLVNRLSLFVLALMCPATIASWGTCHAQSLQLRYGDPVPIEVNALYEKGLKYLASQQSPEGNWPGSSEGQGPGIDGLCVLAFLSHGEDPNFGPYADTIRKGVRHIVMQQDRRSGLLTTGGDRGNMYHQGFGTLALAEAYGAVNEELLWQGIESRDGRSIGGALELAVRCILKAQDQNPFGGWRYTPDAKDADVSVSGANIVALLAARNAGIEVPDKNLKKAMDLLKQSTGDDGSVVYQVGSGSGFDLGSSTARSSIACLSLGIFQEKESDAFQATLGFLRGQAHRNLPSAWESYTRYYYAQAIFQGDFETWKKWNDLNTRRLEAKRSEDGSLGSPYDTAMNLLSMALNYRFLPIYER